MSFQVIDRTRIINISKTSLIVKERVDTSVAHTPLAMVFFFLFAPLFAAFLLTMYVVLCKPGCAISAADTSLV